MIWPSRILSAIGAVLIIVALFVPFAADSVAILDVDSLFDSIDDFEYQIIWALPPLASGIAGVVLPFVLRGRVLGASLIAIGAESLLYYLGYVLVARLEQLGYSGDLAAGGFLGILGGAAMLVGGVVSLRLPGGGVSTLGHDPESTAGQPPRGWYPDPSGQARERFWDGTRWTYETR